MRRKKKDKLPPELFEDFNYRLVSYVCPECRKRYEVELFFTTQNLKASLTKGRWCRCGAAHEIEYHMHQKRTGEILLKVTEFRCNQETKPTRFRQLNQSERKRQ